MIKESFKTNEACLYEQKSNGLNLFDTTGIQYCKKTAGRQGTLALFHRVERLSLQCLDLVACPQNLSPFPSISGPNAILLCSANMFSPRQTHHEMLLIFGKHEPDDESSQNNINSINESINCGECDVCNVQQGKNIGDLLKI